MSSAVNNSLVGRREIAEYATDIMNYGTIISAVDDERHTVRVLISEAVDAVRSRLEEMVLEQPGLELLACEDRIERLLQCLCDARPELLIIGTRLTDATSFEALERIGAELALMNVILLCDRLDGNYLVRARSLGVDYVLESPRDIDFLPSIMRRLAERKLRSAAAGNSSSEEDQTDPIH